MDVGCPHGGSKTRHAKPYAKGMEKKQVSWLIREDPSVIEILTTFE
jgi:hypothetical protein